MSARTLLVPLLALISGAACFAQNDHSDPNSVQRAISKARNEGRFVDAEDLLRDAIQELQQNNPQSSRLAGYLDQLAALVARREGDAAAVPLAKQAYAIDSAAFGPSDLRVANDLDILASYMLRAGDAPEAERLVNEAVSIVRSKEEELRWNQGAGMGAGILAGVVRFYMGENRWVDAELLIPEMMKLCKMIPDEFYEGYCGRPDQTLAEIYRGEGRVASGGDAPAASGFPQQVAALNESAQRYEKDGLYPSAEEAYQKAIGAAARFETDGGAWLGLSLVEMRYLGGLFEREGSKDKAEKIYLDALLLGEREARSEVRSQSSRAAFAAGLPNWSLTNLYRNEDRLPEAEAIVREVLEIQIASLGERHRAIVQTLTELADIYEEEGKQKPAKLSDARTTYERAIAMQEANMGPNDPSVANLLRRYADLLSASNDAAKAAEVRARIASILARQPTDK